MTTIFNQIHQSDRFTYCPKTKSLVCEESDGVFATDLVWVQSSTTKSVLIFKKVGTLKDNDGDTLGWEYVALQPRIKIGNVERMVIYND